MNPLRFSVLIVQSCWALSATISSAAEEDPTAYVQKELRIEFSTFGRGVAEAIRGMGKRAKLGEATEYVVRSEQVGSGYTIKWITKKGEPDTPFPEYMKLNKVGVILPGNTMLGKTSQSEIISRMGKPSAKDGEKLTYQLPGYQGDDIAIFTFRQGKLSVVEWLWFVD
jgi:hypothetical protein